MKRSGLRSDPEATRAFVERGRENARERERAQGREGMRSLASRQEWPHKPAEPPRVRGAATAPSDFRDDDGHVITPPPVKDSTARFGEPKRRKQATIPAGVRHKALARSHGLCVVCLHREGIDPDRLTPDARRRIARGQVSKATTVHHVWPRQKWPALIKAADNLVGACFECHMAHEYPGVKRSRIPRAALPSCVIALAAGDDRMLAYLERTYPA